VHVAEYPVIGLPPSNGATNETVSCALPATTVGCAGGSGTRLGMTTAEAGETALVPFAFVAVIVQVYDFPFVSPETTIGEAAPVAEPAVPEFEDVHETEYEVIARPPSNGATNTTVTWPLPAPTVGAAGAVGTVLGMTAAEAADAAPGPFAFVAVTVQVYDFPFDKLPTTIGEAAPFTDPAVPPFDEEHVAP
jgi:hypothetical protein